MEAKIEARVREIETRLKDIEERMDQLDPSKETEYLNEELDGIVVLIGEVIELFNKDLPEDLEQHFDRYNRLNKKIFGLLERSGKYSNPKQDKLTAWGFGRIGVDNSEVKIDDIDYVGFEDLIPVIREQFKNPAQQLTIALIACLIAFAASYLDWITLRWTKRAYRDDKEEAEAHAEFMDYWIAKISVVITAALNSGPFSAYFKPDTQLTDDFVKKVLERRLEAGSKIPRDKPRYARMRKIGQWIPVPPIPGLSYPLVDLIRTEPAQRHNARVKTLMGIAKDPKELFAFLTEVMPGLAYIGHPETGVNMGNVRARNDQHIGGEYNRKQAKEIGTVCASIQALAERFNNTMSMEAWLSAREELFGKSDELTDICSRLKGEENIEAYTDAVALYGKVFSRHIQVLGEILEKIRLNLLLNDENGMNEKALENLVAQLEQFRQYIEDLGLMDDEEIKPVLEGVLAKIDDDVARIKAIPEERRIAAEEAAKEAAKAALNDGIKAVHGLPPISIGQPDDELEGERRRVEELKARVQAAAVLPEGDEQAREQVAAAMKALEEREQAIAQIPERRREAAVKGVQAEIEEAIAAPVEGKNEKELAAEAAKLAKLKEKAIELGVADKAQTEAVFRPKQEKIEVAQRGRHEERSQHEIQKAFQDALEASRNLPEIVSTQADRTLVGEREKLEGLLVAIKAVGTITDLDIRQQAQEARDRIQEKIKKIDEIRTKRAQEGEELRRRAAVRAREDETVETFERFKEWEKARTSPQDDFGCANLLAEYLGEEALLTGMQALGETVVNSETTARLSMAYDKAQADLEYLGRVDESRRQEIEAMKKLLEQDWEKLKSYFVKL